MCITAQCPDPTEPGVWWREDHCWIKYSPEVTKLIKQAMAAQDTTVSLGVVKSAVHPQGHPYVVNLKTMTQSNFHSGYQRSIKIVPELSDVTDEKVNVDQACEQTGVPKVYYKGQGGEMQAYSDEIARAIILGAAAGVKSVSFVMGTEEDVVVDFEKMSETQHSGGEIATEVKIELPWKPRALDNVKMDLQKNTLQKKLIAALVDGLMDLQFLDKAMRDKFYAVEKLRANPHMQKEENGPKQKFVDVLAQTAANNNKIIGEILDTLKEKNIGRLQSMNIVFHGTRDCNIEGILEFGLDPERSKYPAFYVALKPQTCRIYGCVEKLLLLELMAPSVEVDIDRGVHMIPIAQPELLLPIATAISI